MIRGAITNKEGHLWTRPALLLSTHRSVARFAISTSRRVLFVVLAVLFSLMLFGTGTGPWLPLILLTVFLLSMVALGLLWRPTLEP